MAKIVITADTKEGTISVNINGQQIDDNISYVCVDKYDERVSARVHVIKKEADVVTEICTRAALKESDGISVVQTTQLEADVEKYFNK